MSGPLAELGRASVALSAGDVPAELVDAARQLHGAVAAAAHAGGGRDAEAIGRSGYADAVLGGRVEGALPVIWEAARGDAAKLWVDTVIGLEVAARVGLAGLLAPRTDRVDLRPAAVAAVVTAGRQRGFDAERMAATLCRVVGSVGTVALTETESAPGRSAHAARVALDAEGHAPDPMADGGPYWSDCWAPLPGALGGLGKVWLSRSLAIATGPGIPWTNTAVEGVQEILRRHQKAAEKRLRADQIEKVDLRVNAWTAAADAAAAPEWRIAHQVGAIIATHERNAEQLRRDVPGAADVASKVSVRGDLRLTAKGANELLAGLDGLIGGGLPLVQALMKLLPKPDFAALPELLRARPDRALRAAFRAPGSLDGVDPQPWSLPVEIKLYTTRGGWWPERRSRPEGTLAGTDLGYNARLRWGEDPREPSTKNAADYVKELLA